MKRLHHERMAEKAALAQCIRELEIKDEDNRIIGKLQREVIALRATFQLFASVLSAQPLHVAPIIRSSYRKI
jgi:hypothetical protein